MEIFIHKGLFPGPGFAQINATWQRKNIIDDSPTNLLPVGYIEGYKTAADMLLEELSPYDPRLDMLVFPIFFLYRQFIELLFKKVYENHHTPEQQVQMIRECKHNIVKIFLKGQDCIYPIITENVLYDYQNQQELTKGDLEQKVQEQFEAIKAALEEIDLYDKGSFAFRYNYNRDLTETIPEQLTIDLLGLRQFIDLLSTYFYGEYAI